jgi:uncharacterized protein (TIGR02391 family)
MLPLKNSNIFGQLRKLFHSAITLKESIDKLQSIEAIRILSDNYKKELKSLELICPKEILHSNLYRHSQFLERYIREDKLERCIGDINDLCFTDIFLAEELYLNFLFTSKDPAEKYYDWNSIHPIILKVAKKRFENGHYSDSVEASFKEINDNIKKHYKKLTNIEMDGMTLMRKVFSSSQNNNFNPVFPLADNSTESGKNIQLGYMEIFAGSMQGIRNPKAHENININPDEAWELVILASHLIKMYKKNNYLTYNKG